MQGMSGNTGRRLPPTYNLICHALTTTPNLVLELIRAGQDLFLELLDVRLHLWIGGL